MARRGKVNVSISADSSGLKRGVRDAEGDLGRLQRVGVSSSRGLSAGFKAAGGVIAGAAVADQIRQTIVAAQEAEVSQKKLQAQLKASGVSYQAHAKQIDEVIQKTSKLAGLDDEDLQDAFVAIVRSTGSVNTAMKDMTVVADLARAKHMDVAKAGELVAKVHAGNVGALKRMGIAITPVTTAQDKLKESTKHATVEQTRAAKEADKTATAQKALGLLQRRVAGQAEAYGKTSAGAQDRFRVAVENLRETVGAKLLPILTRVTTKAANFVNQMQDGTGAGGRFADKLKEIADKIRPIVKFFTDHPKLIAVAVGAWAAYRIAASAALVASRLKLIGMFLGLGGKAAAGGAIAGRSFGGAAATSAGTTFNRQAPGRLARGGAWRAAGRTIGLAMAVEIAPQIIKKINDALGIHEGGGGIKGVLDTIVAGAGHLLPDTSHRGPLGNLLFPQHRSRPSSQSPTGATPLPAPRRPSRPSRPASGPGQNAPGGRPRVHASVVAHAASAGPIAHAAASQPHPDDIVAAIEGRADLIDRAHVPYLWGGGHGGRFTGKVIPMDCSGAVSAALGIDPRVSGDFATWGSPGDGGSRGVTVYANRSHVLMKINGRFWGTSRSNPGGGPGWIEGGVPAGYLSGFTVRHMAGSTTVTGGTAAPGRPSRPTRLSAGLIGRGGSKVSGSRLGTRPTAGSTDAYVTPDLPPGTIEALGGDPETNLTSRTMRRFQIGNRIAAIDAALRNPRHSVAYRQRLIAERGQLVGEATDLAKPMAAPEGPTGVDAVPGASAYLGHLDREAAEAELTPDTKDDLDVAKRRATAAHAIYDYMKSHGFSDADVASAARDAKSADDAVTGIQGTTQDNTEAIKALTDEIKRQNDFAAGVSNVSMGQLARSLADFISGQITGTGYDPRAMTAGAGALARY